MSLALSSFLGKYKPGDETFGTSRPSGMFVLNKSNPSYMQVCNETRVSRARPTYKQKLHELGIRILTNVYLNDE